MWGDGEEMGWKGEPERASESIFEKDRNGYTTIQRKINACKGISQKKTTNE
jgi:hypothetical protein